MHIKRLQENQKKLQQKISDFYTPGGLQVYIKDAVSAGVDIEKVISKVEDIIPQGWMSEVEMILVGEFDEFVERSITAAFKDGALYISNFQDDEEDMIDDIVHEIGHSLEEPHGMFLYGDEKVKNEFLQKRAQLHDILWGHGIKTPKAFFNNVEYDEEFDEFLLRKVGYDKLSQYCVGIFINAYAPTSLREYFATAFADFILQPNGHKYLQKISPEVYKKISELYENEKLDNGLESGYNI